MTFAGVSYLAVVIAAVVAWLAGAAWYMIFGRMRIEALEWAPEKIEAAKNRPRDFFPFIYDIYAFAADLVMAWVLAGVLGHLGALTLRAGLISAALCWLGFVMTTLAVNNTFAHRDWRLLWIDGGHWLVALLLMGAVIGAMGV